MTKDFSYLEYVSNRRYLGIMIVAFTGMILFFTFGFNSNTFNNPFTWPALFIIFCIGMIILIHSLGGVHPKDILNYQMWCQDEFKKSKRKSNSPALPTDKKDWWV